MKITSIAIMLCEALLLSLIYVYKVPYSFLLLLVSYIVIGMIHGRYIANKQSKALASVFGVGVIVGVYMTIFNFHVVTGESTVVWFLIGIITNSVVYSLLSSVLVMYIPAYIGIRLVQGNNSQAVPTEEEQEKKKV